MTTPIQSGYPDFGRYQAQATKIYAGAVSGNTNNPITLLIGYVGDIAQMGVRINNLAGTFVVQMSFCSDAAFVTEIGNHTFSLRLGDLFARTVPVLGPFCKVSIIPSTTPMNVDYQFYQAAGAWASLDNDSAANVVLSAFDVSYPAGQTLDEGGVVAPGRAIFSGEATAANTFLELRVVSSSGTVTQLTRITNGQGFVDRQIYLPGQHIEVRIQNNSGVAQFFSYSLTTDIGWGS